MYAFPVEQADGSALIAFEELTEERLGDLDPSIPLTAALVVLWHDGRCLMVFNRFRSSWELPGGMLDPGETPRQAAIRELEEESGQRPDALGLAGVARVQCAPDDRLEHLAIYRGELSVPRPFVANAEMSDLMWWRTTSPVRDLLPIDAALAWICTLPPS